MAVRQADGTSGLVTAVTFEASAEVVYNLTVAGAHTFFVGDGAWLVHNCGNGEALANTAHAAHQRLPQSQRRTTVAAARDAEGTLQLAVYGQNDAAAVETLRGQGYNVLDVAPQGVEFHAERQLYDRGYRTIGISRQSGMCASCQNYFASRPDATIVPYKRHGH